MSDFNPEQIIRKIFAAFTDFSSDPAALSAFMTPDYRQFVDGREMTLDEFQNHAMSLRRLLKMLEIDIQQIVCQGNQAATVHIARATRLSGKQSQIKVIAFYQFNNGRLCLVDELTHVLNGHDGDKSLGSVQ
ncbi:hypothetical protein AD942_03190 [Gluconobacter japonicus]|uniref:Nuclear transport factor 2 family protein n=1 Tax=Gluconobacter japonicus TaxID=376620 RepID=A0A9Q2IS03_GLUJA|nr:nuclear transport factor 2 family protein [Gluconobacter japonicus]KXV37134.1 hypothetical protein AD936_13515 [Gluconobacter japonicus]KXV41312.1 hypothetical protein AD942_03190 [Gluconobacter japonicus]MBF0869684.1 nuclear transport factor 2 family protein [Gluconobacter japonicus]